MQKLVVGSIILLLVTFGWGDRGVGEQIPVPRGELRIVDKSPTNWIWIGWNVLEHLIELDKEGTLVPGLATGWRWLNDRTLEVTLRQGVTFQNGEGFDAEIVQLNWDENIRVRQPHIVEYLTFHPGARLEIVDQYAVRFLFPAPDGAALSKLTVLHMANRQFYREHGWGEKQW
jgi:peptide/nickel transport system substrate-binding protein